MRRCRVGWDWDSNWGWGWGWDQSARSETDASVPNMVLLLGAPSGPDDQPPGRRLGVVHRHALGQRARARVGGEVSWSSATGASSV